MKNSFSLDYYVLVKGEGDDIEFFVDFNDDGTPETCDDITELKDVIYAESNKERLEFMLAEYEERFQGKFRVVKLIKSTSYKIEEE